MSSATVAPAPAPSGAMASLLGFYRDALDRLALLRLTERDPLLVECIERASGELLAGGAYVVRRMRESGRLDNPGLRAVENGGDNRAKAGYR